MGIIIAIYVCGFLISGAIVQLKHEGACLEGASVNDLYDEFDSLSQDGKTRRYGGYIYTFTRKKIEVEETE